MNHLYNTFPMDSAANTSFDERKKQFSRHPDSLFSMALYDCDSLAQQNELFGTKIQSQHPGAAFHPVDEHKDVTLREILDITDDFLLDEDKELPFPSFFEGPTTSSSNLMNRSSTFAPMIPPERPHEVRSFEALSVASAISDELMYGIDIAECKKRRRQVSEDESSEDGSTSKRFRPYQAGQWAEKFEELCQYREKTGHCLVPHTFSENLPLARWVKRQRYQYKLMKEEKPSTMTEERVIALDNIGFVWDSQGAAWGERLTELKDFREVYMHCNVPSNYSENPQLATWVKCQRRQYKLHLEGKPSNMTPQRISELEILGFEWELRSYKKTRC